MSQAKPMPQAKPVERAAEGGDGEMWGLLRQHHSDIGVLQTMVDTLGTNVGALTGKVDEVLHVVTRSTARQGPGLVQIMGGVLLMFGIVGGLSTAIATFVGSKYDSTIAGIQSELRTAKADLDERHVEDRNELFRMKAEARAELTDRLHRLEQNSGWGPPQVTRTQ